MALSFSLTGLLRLVPRWVDDKSATEVTDTATYSQSVSIGNGAATGQANAYWRDVLNIAAGQSASIDLFNLPMKAFGGQGPVALYQIKLLLVVNNSQAAAVSFGAATASRWAGYSEGAISLPAGATLFAINAANGYPVSGSSRNILVENLSGVSSASVDVYIAGVLD
jgi:hypothetical protein